MPKPTAPMHQSCTALTLVPISRRAVAPMSMIPWPPPTSSVVMRRISGHR
jgi:hypothetical protein